MTDEQFLRRNAFMRHTHQRRYEQHWNQLRAYWAFKGRDLITCWAYLLESVWDS